MEIEARVLQERYLQCPVTALLLQALHFTFFFGFVLSVVWPYVSVLEPQSPCYLLLLASRVAFPVQPSLT